MMLAIMRKMIENLSERVLFLEKELSTTVSFVAHCDLENRVHELEIQDENCTRAFCLQDVESEDFEERIAKLESFHEAEKPKIAEVCPLCDHKL